MHTDDTECTACGADINQDNMQRECVCNLGVCQECVSFHQEECSEFVAMANDKWGATTPARNW